MNLFHHVVLQWLTIRLNILSECEQLAFFISESIVFFSPSISFRAPMGKMPKALFYLLKGFVSFSIFVSLFLETDSLIVFSPCLDLSMSFVTFAFFEPLYKCGRLCINKYLLIESCLGRNGV